MAHTLFGRLPFAIGAAFALAPFFALPGFFLLSACTKPATKSDCSDHPYRHTTDSFLSMLSRFSVPGRSNALVSSLAPSSSLPVFS
jgi:hypothetical protein